MATESASESTTANNSLHVPKVSHAVICVFCGSSSGTSPVHKEAARALAHAFHKHSISLVYGGGNVGIMGELASTLASLSGPESVQGVIPQALMEYEGKGGPKHAIGRTTIVPDMHTRKKHMTDLVQAGGPGSGFIALSGGYGTLEELMETVTWNQLGIHDKGLVLYNVDGYWNGLLKWVDDSVAAGFVGQDNRDILVEATDAEACVKALRDYKVSQGRFKLQWNSK